MLALVGSALDAQRGGARGRAGGPAPSPRQAAPIDLAGYWVSPIIEDWKYRMVTPNKGVFDAVPLNAEGRKLGESWDPAKDEAAGEQCRAYGAGGIMRVARAPAHLVAGRHDAEGGDRHRHADATASLRQPARSDRSDLAGTLGRAVEHPPPAHLKVVTTNLRPGYVRKNGAPYSEKATVTEYWDLNKLPNGDRWLTVITKVEDPQYFTRAYTTSSDFKKLADATGWNPTPCSAR